MIRFTVRVIGSLAQPTADLQNEVILFNRELDQYESVDFDELISDALNGARLTAGVSSLPLLKEYSPQITFSLSVENEPTRAVLSFSLKTIEIMAEAGVSFDFDPYIYD